MNKVTQLAAGNITAADTLAVQLVQPPDTPPAVLIRWPSQPLVVQPSQFSAAANTAMHVLATAVTQLAALKARGL